MHAHLRSALISNLVIIIFFLQLEVNFIPEKQSCFSKDKFNLPIYLKSYFSFETVTVFTSVVTPVQIQMHQTRQCPAACKKPKGLEV